MRSLQRLDDARHARIVTLAGCHTQPAGRAAVDRSGIFAPVDPFAAEQAHALTVVAEAVLTDQAELVLNPSMAPRRRRHHGLRTP